MLTEGDKVFLTGLMAEGISASLAIVLGAVFIWKMFFGADPFLLRVMNKIIK